MASETQAQPQNTPRQLGKPPSGGSAPSGSPSSSGKPSVDSTGRSNINEHHFLAPDARQGTGGNGQNGLSRWEAALGNIEDARVAFDTLCRSIEDAVYLDEEAYKQVTPTMQFTKVIQAQHRKIEQLEAQLRATKQQLAESNAVQSQALQRAADFQQEIENNAVVFKMHYDELMEKQDEIEKLSAVIQVLSQK